MNKTLVGESHLLLHLIKHISLVTMLAAMMFTNHLRCVALFLPCLRVLVTRPMHSC